MTDKLNTIWESALIDKNLDPNEYRLDDFGAIIKRTEHGKQTEYGWSVDHIFPVSKGGDDNIRNLQALHWSNNKLKGDSFPTFNYSTSKNRNSNSMENITAPRPEITFREDFIETLSDIYPNILQYSVSPLGALML